MDEMQERLDLIESMIKKARNNFSENGHLYIVWGWVILGCCLVQYFAGNLMGYKQANLVWWLCWAVIPYMIWYIRLQKKKERVRTYTDEIMDTIWIAFGVSAFLIGFVIGKNIGQDTSKVILPVYLVLYGIPTLLCGVILRFRPLVIGGISCWMLAVLSIFVAPREHVLLIAAAMIAGWLLPGYLLRLRHKKEMAHV